MTTVFRPLWAIFLALTMLSACDGDHKAATAAATDSISTGLAAASSTIAMPPITHSNKDLPTELAGHQYVWTSSRTSNETEQPINIKGKSYYDNSIRLHVRTGNKTIFDRTFQKQDFAAYLSEDFRQDGLLINLVGIGSQGNSLKFIATIGYPDGIDDEAFQSVTISLSSTGEITFSAPQTDELEPPALTTD